MARARQIAQPGDPDLDCDLAGVTITSVVAVDETREVLVRTVGGYGRWADAGTGEMVNGVHDVDCQLSARLPTMPDHLWRAYVGMLECWRASATPLPMSAATGRVTLLIENRSTFLPWPSRPDPLAADIGA